jgi:hypothetical protein
MSQTGFRRASRVKNMKMKFNFIFKTAIFRTISPALFFLYSLGCLPAWAESQPAPIQDNSFLVEEAYNQEKGVIQHINTFSYLVQSRDWSYTFTQEWPVGGLRHQFSYTLAVARPGAFAARGAGIGDSLLNYRYQWVGNGDTRVAFAPRLSVILPSGNYRVGHGYGGAGVQSNLPLSVVLNRQWVTHWNSGATFVPRARSENGDRASCWNYSAGQSVIWLAKPRFNVMLETFMVRAQSVSAPGKTKWSSSLFLNPGVRWAYNFSSGLQIVPGLGIPMGVGPSQGEKGVFVYLSFEHPLRRIAE